jgi:hypothetical protein
MNPSINPSINPRINPSIRRRSLVEDQAKETR